MLERKTYETHIAFDIETNGTAIDCGIWEIGMAVQHLERGEAINVEPMQYDWIVKPLNVIGDPETIEWLQQQGRFEDYERACEQGAEPLNAAQDIVGLLAYHEGMRLSAVEEGTTEQDHSRTFWSWRQFDYPRLEFMFRELGITIPWKYWETRDAASVHPYCAEITRPASNHHAKYDALETLRCSVGVHNMLHARL